jgi:hypothetical protein
VLRPDGLLDFVLDSAVLSLPLIQKEEATVRTIIQQDAVGNPPAKRTQQRHVQLQERLQNLCRDLTTGQKTIAEYLCGVGWNIRLNHQY